MTTSTLAKLLTCNSGQATVVHVANESSDVHTTVPVSGRFASYVKNPTTTPTI